MSASELTLPAPPDLAILVLAKAPQPGFSKTRLAPRFGFDAAAELAAAALADTLEAVAATPARQHTLVLDGPMGSGASRIELPIGFTVVAQRGVGQAARIANALAACHGPALLIGMDTPQVTPALLALELTDLTEHAIDAWLGPAEDGGWWALGLRDPRRWARAVCENVPMSTPTTGAAQRRRLLDAGLKIAPLPTLRDVDHPDDAYAVARLIPHSRFARRLLQEPALSGATR